MAVEFFSVITEINKLSAIRDNKLAVHKVKTDTQGKLNVRSQRVIIGRSQWRV